MAGSSCAEPPAVCPRVAAGGTPACEVAIAFACAGVGGSGVSPRDIIAPSSPAPLRSVPFKLIVIKSPCDRALWSSGMLKTEARGGTEASSMPAGVPTAPA